ncbi:unnamed protein product [Danaus chrysippus]|uniref:(African queen) hypothetical protein n=1 Tax=Danaus chrysippus TaxID=151541 RepID=A0A8J2QPK4_9NEOP|nr:unnamed protein product [Danaus chrysippus]
MVETLPGLCPVRVASGPDAGPYPAQPHVRHRSSSTPKHTPAETPPAPARGPESPVSCAAPLMTLLWLPHMREKKNPSTCVTVPCVGASRSGTGREWRDQDHHLQQVGMRPAESSCSAMSPRTGPHQSYQALLLWRRFLIFSV